LVGKIDHETWVLLRNKLSQSCPPIRRGRRVREEGESWKRTKKVPNHNWTPIKTTTYFYEWRAKKGFPELVTSTWYSKKYQALSSSPNNIQS